jgi:hypothetical protein
MLSCGFTAHFLPLVLARYPSIHHRTTDSNFRLFMPLFDALRGTMKYKSSELQKKNSAGPPSAFNITLYEKYVNLFIVPSLISLFGSSEFLINQLFKTGGTPSRIVFTLFFRN